MEGKGVERGCAEQSSRDTTPSNVYGSPSCAHSTAFRKVLLTTLSVKAWLSHQNVLDKSLCLCTGHGRNGT